MCRLGEAPPYPEIRAEADDEHPFAALRHAVVRRIQHFGHDVVFGPAVVRRVMLFKPVAMFAPRVASAPAEVGIHELQTDVLEIGGERLAFESFDILEDERLRAQPAHGADGLGEHISLIEVATVLAAHGEGLARGTARHDHDITGQRRIVKTAYVALVQRPLIHEMRTVALVFPKRLTRVGVPFDDCGVMESGLGHSNG